MQSISRPALVFIHFVAYAALWFWFSGPVSLAAATLASILIWISTIDVERFEIPDTASAALMVSGLLTLAFPPYPNIVDAALGGLIWPLVFWGVAKLFKKRRGMDGLGFGDVKLMAGIGVWCGFIATINVVLAASVSGIVLLAIGQFTGSQKEYPLKKTMVAFGPFLCLSAWAVWLSELSI